MGIDLWRKVVVLFCFVSFCSYEIHQTRMLQIVFWVSLESSWQEGCMGFVSMVFGLAMQKFFNIEFFSLKIRLICSWKFRRNRNVPFVLLERTWWERFNGIHLVRFGFRMWQILIFKWFSAAENSKKFQKTRFWNGKSFGGCGNIWANGTSYTSLGLMIEQQRHDLCGFKPGANPGSLS